MVCGGVVCGVYHPIIYDNAVPLPRVWSVGIITPGDLHQITYTNTTPSLPPPAPGSPPPPPPPDYQPAQCFTSAGCVKM